MDIYYKMKIILKGKSLKFLIISDIHSNFEALKCVIEEIKRDSFDRIVCLGDIVGYGPQPDECVKFIRNNSVVSITGNHERMLFNPSLRIYANVNARRAIEWTDGIISVSSREFLEKLPVFLKDEEKRISFVHGSPCDPDEYIFKISVALRSIEKIKNENIRLCFFGHTHIPGIIDEDGNLYYEENVTMALDFRRYYLINPGSVGQPRDRDPRASFCVFDDAKNTVKFYRREYNISKTVEKIEEYGLPLELGERLWYGV
jgi:predicted phosphodiesterase